MIRFATVQDAAAIAAIYNPYIETTVISFEELPVSEAEMTHRIQTLTATHPWLVAESEGKVVGYAYAAPWRPRSAYRFAVETTVYLQQGFLGKGLGTQLYHALIDEMRQRNVKTAFGGIALPNDASVALHEKMGFKKCGHLFDVGFKFEQWIDVGYWQLLL